MTMVMNLDKCIGCHTCSVTCKNTWTNRPGAEYMYFNNVETKPGLGYPRKWEDQEKFNGGWELKNGKLQLKSGSKLQKLKDIFYNPDQPTMEDYYEPWDYTYDELTKAKEGKHQPIARPRSKVTGDYMDLKSGPNWDDDLAGAPETAHEDPLIQKMEEAVKMEFEEVFMMYLPRLCEHCMNPSCVSACPSGAMYKRDEDGIVLVDQNACRAWRMCISNCPYKKVYFNWKTNKAEKCTLCFPRIEVGLPTICSETCVGRIRYLGLLLYDADRVQEAASVEDVQDLYESQLDIFLDPHDPKIIEQARKDGIPNDWIEAAQQSPTYKMIKEWKIALPLHPEYRTLPMIWYVPPLSPIMNLFEGKGTNNHPDDIFPAIDEMRIPIEYLANLLSAGDKTVIRTILKKMEVMRMFMRSKNANREPNREHFDELLLNDGIIEDMYRLLAIAKYNERFVIPEAHKEHASELLKDQGSCGLNFDGGPGGCGVF